MLLDDGNKYLKKTMIDFFKLAMFAWSILTKALLSDKSASQEAKLRLL